MIIKVVTKDKRYSYLEKMLSLDGHTVSNVDYASVGACDALILPIKQELSDGELQALLKSIDNETLVVSGYSKKIKEFYDGIVFDYSGCEALLQKNAYLTAEATISVVQKETESSVYGMKIFVSGYGRIGKALCRLFSFLGARIFAYARREEVKEQILSDGYSYASLEYAPQCDVIINTVPAIIFDEELINKIPHSSKIIDLASLPGGFATADRAIKASGLPGKILPKSSAKAIYDAIIPLFPCEKGK